MSDAIVIQNLTKIFKRQAGLRDIFLRSNGTIIALDDVSLRISEGEIFGFLGPNGAGKTTLIKSLSTLILPTNGTAKIYDNDIVNNHREVKKLIGLIHSDERSFFWRLTGRQNLEFFAAIFEIPRKIAKIRIDELLSLVDLEETADTMFHNYSTGMKQRLAIARGLLSRPKILFMDEPMRSIDPISTRKIREFIKTKALDMIKGAVVLATNRLDEAIYLCDRVAILNRGRLVTCGKISEIQGAYNESILYELEVKNITDETIKRIGRMKWVQNIQKKLQVDGNVSIVLKLTSEEESIHSVLHEIMKNNGHIQKCRRKELSFEESFSTVISES